jgi:phage-related protein
MNLLKLYLFWDKIKMSQLKEVVWINSAKKDLSIFPPSVKDEGGYALHRVQEGKLLKNIKRMQGLGTGVMEICSDYNTNTYRAVYLLNIDEKIYVLHCFQKKSKRGIETPREEIEVIKQRIKWLKKILRVQETEYET